MRTAGGSPGQALAAGNAPTARGRVRRGAAVALPCLAGALVLASGACWRMGPGEGTARAPTVPVPLPPVPRVAAEPSPGRTAPPLPPVRFAEVRALWVVRTTLTGPEAIRTMVAEARRGGFNTLLVQVRGRGDAYYGSKLEPRAEALADQPRDFDPLALVLEEAHARGMAVHAWVNAMVVTNLTELPSDPAHIVRADPDLLAVPRELARDLADVEPSRPAYLRRVFRWARARPDRLEGLYVSPVRPEAQDHLVAVLTDLVGRYPVDGVHLDYVRYPSREFDYSRGAVEAFRAWASPRIGRRRTTGLDAEGREDALAWPDGLPELWDDFRRERLTALVARVHRRVRALRPEVVISAAVVPDTVEARHQRLQDWPAWLDRGLVDVVAPMAYTPDDGRFRSQVTDALAAAGDRRRVWAGIGTHRTGFDGAVAKIRIARDLGAGGVALFSYDWIRGRGPRGRAFLEDVGRRAFGAFTPRRHPPRAPGLPWPRRPAPGPPGTGG